MVICLERGADLHMAKLMPLPLTVSCSSKIQIGFTFLVPVHPGSPGKRAVKRLCVCLCVTVKGLRNLQDSALARSSVIFFNFKGLLTVINIMHRGLILYATKQLHGQNVFLRLWSDGGCVLSVQCSDVARW